MADRLKAVYKEGWQRGLRKWNGKTHPTMAYSHICSLLRGMYDGQYSVFCIHRYSNPMLRVCTTYPTFPAGLGVREGRSCEKVINSHKQISGYFVVIVSCLKPLISSDSRNSATHYNHARRKNPAGNLGRVCLVSIVFQFFTRARPITVADLVPRIHHHSN